MSFSINSIRNRSLSSAMGGGHHGLMIALAEDCIIIPEPEPDNQHLTSDDFVFAQGRYFIPIFSENEKIKITEEKGDGYTNAYTSKIVAFYPGDDDNIRQFVGDLKVGQKEAYALITHCTEHRTYLLGKGLCCSAMAKFNFDSGDDGNPRGWNVEITAKADGPMTIYSGVGSSTRRFLVPVNADTPDVSRGPGTYVLPQNSTPTAITILNNAVAGSLYVLEWNSITEHSTIANSATFMLAGAFAPAQGAKLYLQAVTATTFSERGRYIPE